MINGDFYGREMWIAFHSIAAKYVLLSKLLTLTLIVQSTLPSFQLQSVGYSWLGGFPSLQIPSAVRIRNSWVSGHPRGDQILRWRCARCQSARNFLHKAPQTRHGIVTMSTPSTPQGWWKCSSSSAISSRLMSSSITLPHVTYVTCDFPVDDVDVETACHWSRGSHLPFSWKLFFPLSCFLAHLEVNSFVSACLPPVQQPVLHHAMPCYHEGVW